MNLKSKRGEVVTIVVVVLALLGATQLVPNWRVTNIFKKDEVKAATKELTQAQADLAKAQADAKAAQDALAAAKSAELAKKDSQVAYAQQMAAGASESLKNATPEPPVKLAIALLDRTNNGLAAAIGALPQDKQAEIIKIVADTLSGVQGRLEDANAKLAEKDRELAVVTTERESLKAQIPVLQTQLVTKDAAMLNKTAEVAQKTQEVVTVAQKLQQHIKDEGSATALADSLTKLLVGLVILYLVAHNLLPAIAREFPQYSLLTKAANAVKNATTGHP